MTNHNLYTALRAGFPADLDTTAIETGDTPPVPLHYTWRDLDRGAAMMANLLDSLSLPPASRIAAHVDKSVEALMLYLAVLRAGHVYLPLNVAYQHSEMAYFIGNAEPAVVVCGSRNFGWISKLAFTSGTRHVYTLDEDRSGTLLARAAHHTDEPATSPPSSTPAEPRGAARARCSATATCCPTPASSRRIGGGAALRLARTAMAQPAATF
jgi:malonyl-CoA/methylmalonyl-CoA synthetase